ncbi:MAG TPA: hypothetical protein VE912_19455 [Bacteroidales bacterium]|nr:hypothetical protein [Bacteroidales bacterium]
MKTLGWISVILLFMIGLSSCEKNEVNNLLDTQNIESQNFQVLNQGHQNAIATGSVEVLWKGGGKGKDMGNQPDSIRAFFEFNAHEGNSHNAAKGNIYFRVTNPDLTPHREIMAEITGVQIIGEKAWFVAVVVSDSKGCGGNDQGGHESGCSGSDNHEGGMDGVDPHDGGCTDSGSDEGGCSDGEEHDSEEGGGSPGGDMGNPASGKNCRIGQVIAVKVHDAGTPGIYDGITWKWFNPDASLIPSIDNIDNWPHLCKKTIIGGNLVVHNK